MPSIQSLSLVRGELLIGLGKAVFTITPDELKMAYGRSLESTPARRREAAKDELIAEWIDRLEEKRAPIDARHVVIEFDKSTGAVSSVTITNEPQ